MNLKLTVQIGQPGEKININGHCWKILDVIPQGYGRWIVSFQRVRKKAKKR